MNCVSHRKVIVGGCFWCGRLVCNHCITMSNGKKLYCSKCTSDLGNLLKRRIPELEVYAQR